MLFNKINIFETSLDPINIVSMSLSTRKYNLTVA